LARRLFRLRGGATDLPALVQEQKLRERALSKVTKHAKALRQTLNKGKAVPDFGSQMESILADALKEAGDQEGLRAAVLASLEPVFMQQILLLKDEALEQVKKGLLSNNADAAMLKAEEEFERVAQSSVPQGSGWSFDRERENLGNILRTVRTQKSNTDAAKREHTEGLQTAMQYLSMQQQQMRAIQAQYMGGQGGNWDMGVAFRPLNSDLNLGASIKDGRGNLHISMVPDEGAHLLGPNGFTSGVGPANVGLSLNVHL